MRAPEIDRPKTIASVRYVRILLVLVNSVLEKLTCDFRDQNHCSSLFLICGKINCRDRIEFLIEFKIYVTLPLLFPSSLSLSASLLSSSIPTHT